MIRDEAGDQGEHSLKRVLGPMNLITLGIGAIIGTGIFVLTGSVAAQNSGPAIVLSFILAGVGCAFAGLCYAEFASLIPIAGSAYTYGYATLGEIFAWIIGWDLILEYAFGAATVASGWSANVVQLLARLGIDLPPQLIATPGTALAYYQKMWTPVTALPAGVEVASLPHATAVFNLVAFLAIAVVTSILVIGIQESATLNTIIVFVKVGTVLVFIAVAGLYVFQHLSQATANWTPFVPPNAGSFGEFGWSGIARGAGVIFFAYIGFDAVSTAAQESRNPQKDMPTGILGSLVICTILYIVTSWLLTGVISYKRLNVGAPIALGMSEIGVRWGEYLVLIGTIMGQHRHAGDAAGPVARVLFDVARRAAAPMGGRGPSAFPDALDFLHHRGRLRRHSAGVPAHQRARPAHQHRHPAGLCDCVCGRLAAANAPSRVAPAIQDATGAVGSDSRHHRFSAADGCVALGNLAPPGHLAHCRDGDLFRLRPEKQPRPAASSGVA